MKKKKSKDGFIQLTWKDFYASYFKENPDVDKDTYKNVIGSYFDIYFGELYFFNKPKYFFLSGMLKKARGNKFYSYKTQRVQRHHGINLVWYNRPSLSFFMNVKMLKVTSTRAPLQRMEQKWRERNDDALLPRLMTVMRSIKLYKDD